jgi:hypothetical protein
MNKYWNAIDYLKKFNIDQKLNLKNKSKRINIMIDLVDKLQELDEI